MSGDRQDSARISRGSELSSAESQEKWPGRRSSVPRPGAEGRPFGTMRSLALPGHPAPEPPDVAETQGGN